MKLLTSSLAILLFIGVNIKNSSAQPPQWKDLKPGQYTVGYKVLNNYDHSRHIKPLKDFEGKLNEGERALPVQVHIWYPAVKGSAPMLFEDYIYISAQRQTYKPLSDTEKRNALNNLKGTARFAAQIELTDDQLIGIGKTPVAAYRDAKNLKGPFPVIITGPDAGGPARNNVLYEYLASRGYVVIAIPANEHLGALQSNNPELALTERIGTMEYIMGLVHDIPYADNNHIGVLGINFDGMTALLFQMKNMQAEAVVSLDGWEGKEGSASTVTTSPLFDILKMRVPFFSVYQDEKDPPPYLILSSTLYDTLLYSDRYTYSLKEMGHLYLISQMNFLPALPADKVTAYHFLYSSIVNFFDAYLKQSPEALRTITKPAAERGIPSSMIKLEKTGKALPPAPTNAELESMYTKGEYDKIVRSIQAARKHSPPLNQWGPMLDLYGMRLTRTNNFPNAISILTLNTELYPGNPWYMDRLAQAYEASGDIDKMKKVAEEIIALLNKKEVLSDDEKELKTEAEKRLGVK